MSSGGDSSINKAGMGFCSSQHQGNILRVYASGCTLHTNGRCVTFRATLFAHMWQFAVICRFHCLKEDSWSSGGKQSYYCGTAVEKFIHSELIYSAIWEFVPLNYERGTELIIRIFMNNIGCTVNQGFGLSAHSKKEGERFSFFPFTVQKHVCLGQLEALLPPGRLRLVTSPQCIPPPSPCACWRQEPDNNNIND